MNRYRITALEDVDVSVSDEHTATILVRGVPRQVPTRGTSQWKHLTRGETFEVAAVHGVRGDLFEARDLNLPTETAAPVVIHQALQIERLPSPNAGCASGPVQSNAASNP